MVDLSDIKVEIEDRPHHPFYPQAVAFPPRKKYLIAMTPRSGSTRLAQYFSLNGVLGYPGEFLNEGFIANLGNFFPPPNFEDFENFILSTFTSPAGVFGVKTDWWRYATARRLGRLQSLYEAPDLIVFLRRKDLVRQAVSLSVSKQSGVWHDHHLIGLDPDEVYATLAYDGAEIAESLIALMESEYRWIQEFEASDVEAIEIFYEDVMDDLAGAERLIAEGLGIAVDFTSEEPPEGDRMQRTPSRVNGEWLSRFTAENPALVAACQEGRGWVSPADWAWREKLAANGDLEAFLTPPPTEQSGGLRGWLRRLRG